MLMRPGTRFQGEHLLACYRSPADNLPVASPAPGAALGYRTRGRDAATFQIALSGICTTPKRPPHNGLAGDFSGQALTRRRRR
jgi:hypothetical protein